MRNEADSMPNPATAPPSVMVFNCGTTSGDRPYGQSGGHQIFVGAHAGHVGGACVRVNRNDVRQP